MFYFYLNQESLREAGILISSDGKYHFGRTIAEVSSEGIYIVMNGNLDLPSMMPFGVDQKFIHRITVIVSCEKMPSRRPGIYRYGSAELTPMDSPNNATLVLNVSGKNLEDMVQVYRLFRRGLLPPAIDYSRPQVAFPLRTVRELLKEAWMILHARVSIQLTQVRMQMARL